MKGVVKGGNNGVGLKTTDKQSIIDIINSADATEANIKSQIATAINAVDTGSINLPTTATWQQIKDAIPNIVSITGKKFASGSVKSSPSTDKKPFMISAGGSTVNYSYLNVTGLTFKPSTFIFYSYNSGTHDFTYYAAGLVNAIIMVEGVYNQATWNAYSIQAGAGTITVIISNTTLLVPAPMSDVTYNWYAFE